MLYPFPPYLTAVRQAALTKASCSWAILPGGSTGIRLLQPCLAKKYFAYLCSLFISHSLLT